MSVSLQAPVPAVQTTTLLPNPQMGDTQGRKHSVDIFRAIDGTLRTSVKSNQRHVLSYSFNLTRLKAAEVEEFVNSYMSSKIRMRNHKNEIWEGYFANNPIEITGGGRDGASEFVEVQLQFDVVRIS
jgi:hypothetical protein